MGVGVVDCFETVSDTTFLGCKQSSISARKIRFAICIAVGDEEKETEVQMDIESAFIAERGC